MRILLLGDIHIGAIDNVPYVFNTITDIIDKEIKFNKTDLVVILGDYFDKLFKANDEFISLSINIMNYLINACNNSNTKIRIIYGTQSHDSDQYNLFNNINLINKIDIKLFTTVTEECINNKNILFMPEEYMYDKHEFYKDTLYNENKHYDYIFGHGNVKDGMPDNIIFKTASDGKEKQVPLFETKEFINRCDICCFNHYHCHVDKNNFHYIGSLFRWKFNEDPDKGYGIIEDDEFKFIINKDAFIFKTYEYPEDSKIYDSQDNLIKEINKIKNENKDIITGEKIGKIRMILYVPKNCKISIKEILKSVLIDSKCISTVLKEEKIISVEDNSIVQEYDFVLDNSMKIIDKIYAYINKVYDNPFSLATLNRYINDELD